MESTAHHMEESHLSHHWNKKTQSNNMIVQLKTQIRTSGPSVHKEKKESQALKEGFYHPTLKRPRDRVTEDREKKKTNTQYYIFKEKGKIKKVVRTVFKPNISSPENIAQKEEDKRHEKEIERYDSEDFMEDTKDIEESSVDDELSCNLDDLLRSFEEEEELSQSSPTDPLVKDFKNNFSEVDLENSSLQIKMCVDAFENIDNTDSREPEDEIECMEVRSISGHERSWLNVDLADEIHCRELSGVRKPKTLSKVSGGKKDKEAEEKVVVNEKLSECLLCDRSLESFSQLLGHITSKHCQPEVMFSQGWKSSS